VSAWGKAIVWGRDAGGGGTAITVGDDAGRGVLGAPRVLAAVGEALAVRAAARGLAVPGGAAPPSGPEAQPDISAASAASVARRPGVKFTLASSVNRQAWCSVCSSWPARFLCVAAIGQQKAAVP
jgi:hypothetical protein